MHRIPFVFIAALLASACSSSDSAPLTARAESEAPPPQAEATQADGASAVSLVQERMVVREARLRLRAESPREVARRAEAVAAQAGGFVLNSEVEGTDGVPHEVVLQLRVPAEALEQTLGRLRALGEVLQEQVSGQDVTEEFVDVSARLAAHRALEVRLLALLERSGELEDLLQVERELARVRADIESKQGRVRYLRERARMASVEVVASTPERPLLASTQSVGSRLTNAASRAAEVSVTTLELLIVSLGWLLPLSLLLTAVWWGRRAVRQRLTANA